MASGLYEGKGFSIVELIVGLSIMAVLIGAGVGFYVGHVEKARVSRAKDELRLVQAALEEFKTRRGVYPASAGELGEAGFPAAGDGPFELEAHDPWGRPYQYRADDGATAYVLETGYNRVQGVAGRVVLASGRDGTYELPSVGEERIPGP